MDLELDTLNKLRNLIDCYKGKKYDEKFIIYTYEILNQDPYFSGVINYEFNNEGRLETENSNGNITIDLNKIDKLAYENGLEWDPNSTNKLENYNYYYLLTILHECMHTVQYLIASGYIKSYPEIKELNNLFINFRGIQEIFLNVNYALDGVSFSFERNANLGASNVINLISPSNICDTSYNFYVYQGYRFKGNEVICPVETSLKKCLHKMIDVKSDIPFGVRLEQGLPITSSEFDKILDLVNTEYLKDVDTKKLRKLIKRM